MKIRFWGVRGSIPTPITPLQVQAKITAAIQRITKNDIKSPDAKQKFISELPEWIFGTTGGNTACIELKDSDGNLVILDAGSGIRGLGKNISNSNLKNIAIVFSHLHWDHIQGIPFFDPIYNKNAKIQFYSASENTRGYLKKQQETPFFPEPFENIEKRCSFNTIECGKLFKIHNFNVHACPMSHPGISYSYAFEENGKKIVYATDVELTQNDFESTEEKEKVFRNADCIILDSQYTVEEAYKKVNWGHSAFCFAIDFACHWGIKKIFLFHHEPTYDDKKLNAILVAARWYTQYIAKSDLKVYLASENLEFEL